MTSPIEYISYNKVVDNVYYLGDGIVLKFNVLLAKKGYNGQREFFHKEFRYNNPIESWDIDKLITVRRDFDFYLSLEKYNDKSAFTMITVQDMLFLKATLNEVFKWVQTDAFAIRGKNLVLQNKRSPIVMKNLAPNNRYLQFEPIIVNNNEFQKEGIRITMGDSNIFGDITLDQFAGFIYTIDTFNMYTNASIIIGYMNRPPAGYNLIDFENENSIAEQHEKREEQQIELERNIRAKQARQIKGVFNNFFDKIDNLNT